MSRRYQYAYDYFAEHDLFDGTETVCDVDEALCSKNIPCEQCPKFQAQQEKLDKDWDESLESER